MLNVVKKLGLDRMPQSLYHIDMTFFPTTKLGKWSAGLIVGFVVFLLAFYVVVAIGYRGGDTFWSQPMLTIPILIAAACGISAFVCGVVSFFKKERSVLVLAATLIGLFVLWFVAAELLFPH